MNRGGGEELLFPDREGEVDNVHLTDRIRVGWLDELDLELTKACGHH